MVGRDRELDILLELERSARSGTPRAVIIDGEAGIGKSRLVREFVDRVDEDVVVAIGECVDLGSVSVPFAPIRGIVRGLWDPFGAETIHLASGPGMSSLLSLLPPSAMPDWRRRLQPSTPQTVSTSRCSSCSRRSATTPTGAGTRGPALGGSRDAEPHALHASVPPSRADPDRDHVSRRRPRSSRIVLRPVLAELDRGRGVARLELEQARSRPGPRAGVPHHAARPVRVRAG